MEENLKIPAHVALILDGNGRWAKKRGLPRQLGHKKGCETVEQIVEDAARLGIRYLTVYGFSTENWKRPAEEVGALMQLFRYYAKRLLKIAKANNVRVRMIGERSRFAPDFKRQGPGFPAPCDLILYCKDLFRFVLHSLVDLLDGLVGDLLDLFLSIL